MRYSFALAILLAAVPAVSASDAPEAGPVVLSPREIYQKVGPSVVFIYGSSEDGGSGEIGTGSIVDPSHVLTNAHVVIRDSSGEPWPTIRVYRKPAKITGDNKKDLKNPIAARVARFDRALDLALLELRDPPSGLKPVALGDSAGVAPGDPVVAIGHPEQGGLWTLTQGVVSTVLADFDKVPGKDVFQTDASINRGNSGGPLLARDGSQIGVNTAMSRRAPDGTAITAVNFSLQSNVVKRWLGAGYATPAALVTVGPKETETPAQAPGAAIAESSQTAVARSTEAAKVVDVPKPAVPPPAPPPPAPGPKILTPAKPYRAENLEAEMREMEDLSKEMEQEIQRREH